MGQSVSSRGDGTRLSPPFDGVAQQAIAQMIRAGGMMAYPTETHYALGGNALDAELCARVDALKGRQAGQALLLLINGPQMAGRYAECLVDPARVLMDRFWPGPLTLVFAAAPGLPPHLRHEKGTVAMRVSPHPLLRDLLDHGRVPLIGTSANRSGAPPARTADEVTAAFPGEIDLLVDGGPTAGGLSSTLVDTTAKPFRILRAGALPTALIQAALVETYIEYVPE